MQVNASIMKSFGNIPIPAPPLVKSCPTHSFSSDEDLSCHVCTESPLLQSDPWNMLNSTASRAIAPTTARLQLRLPALRLTTRCYANYQPAPRRYNGGDVPREGQRDSYRSRGHEERQPDPRASGYSGSNRSGGGERQTNIRRDGREYTPEGYKLPRVGRNTEYENRKYNQRQDTRERQPAGFKDGETDWLAPRKKKSNTAEDTIVPQLTQDELRSIFSQELFVFRCDLNATQITPAMFSYPQLRDVGVLTSIDVSNLARQLHTHYRLDGIDKEVLPHIKTLVEDIKGGKVPGNPLASVHILSCLKEMEEFDLANEFWKWLEPQNEEHTDARVYGAAIECLAYQGAMLDVMEDMYTEALERYSDSTAPAVARDTGKGTRVMLFQGIITARLLHGDWEAAYEGFDLCVRLYPTLTPPRIYELIIYERSVKEAYIVFLMACRAGTPPKPTVLTPLLKQLWAETGDVRAMIRALYAFVGSGGKPTFQHLNSLIGGIFGTIGQVPKNARSGEQWDEVYANAMKFTRSIITAFAKVGVKPSLSTFNTIITLGGKLERVDLVYAGLKELAAAGMEPNIITYRIILNAFGELNDPESVRQSWLDLCIAKKEPGQPYDIKDIVALVKACVRTNQTDFCHFELGRLKHTIGTSLYRVAIEMLKNEKQQHFVGSFRERNSQAGSEFPISRSSQNELLGEIEELEKVFGSSQIHDFSTSSMPLVLPPSRNKQSVVDIDSTSPSFGSEIPRTELQKFYDTLTTSASKIDIGEDPLLRTSTGYSVKDLRFENWRSVNRLLYEAEVYEREKKEALVKRSKARAIRERVVDPDPIESAPKQEIRKLFGVEERAKKRIEEIKKGIKAVKIARESGDQWKKEELKVRGRMGGEMKEPMKISNDIIT